MSTRTRGAGLRAAALVAVIAVLTTGLAAASRTEKVPSLPDTTVATTSPPGVETSTVAS